MHGFVQGGVRWPASMGANWARPAQGEEIQAVGRLAQPPGQIPSRGENLHINLYYIENLHINLYYIEKI